MLKFRYGTVIPTDLLVGEIFLDIGTGDLYLMGKLELFKFDAI